MQKSKGKIENLRIGDVEAILLRHNRNGPNAVHGDAEARSGSARFSATQLQTICALEQNDSFAPKPLVKLF